MVLSRVDVQALVLDGIPRRISPIFGDWNHCAQIMWSGMTTRWWLVSQREVESVFFFVPMSSRQIISDTKEVFVLYVHNSIIDGYVKINMFTRPDREEEGSRDAFFRAPH